MSQSELELRELLYVQHKLCKTLEFPQARIGCGAPKPVSPLVVLITFHHSGLATLVIVTWQPVD